MTMKDRIKALCKVRGTSMNKVENDLGFGTGYISKLDKSTPNSKNLQRIADHLGVTTDFINGKTDKIWCSECEYSYNPLNKESLDLHEKIHANYINAISKYGFCYSSDKCRNEMCDCLNAFSCPSPSYSVDDIANAYIEYMEFDFSEFLRNSNYNLKYDSFDDFARERIIKDMHQNFMSHDLFIILSEKYNIKSEYIDIDEQLLARASNNQQLMRILSYAEKLSPETLNSLEVQIRALAENKKEG